MMTSYISYTSNAFRRSLDFTTKFMTGFGDYMKRLGVKFPFLYSFVIVAVDAYDKASDIVNTTFVKAHELELQLIESSEFYNHVQERGQDLISNLVHSWSADNGKTYTWWVDHSVTLTNPFTSMPTVNQDLAYEQARQLALQAESLYITGAVQMQEFITHFPSYFFGKILLLTGLIYLIGLFIQGIAVIFQNLNRRFPIENNEKVIASYL